MFSTSYNKHSDQELQQLFWEGKYLALKVLNERYDQRLLTRAMSWLKNRFEAEEAVMDTLLAFYYKVQDRELIFEVEKWLMHVVKNKCLDRLRRSAKEELMQSFDDSTLLKRHEREGFALSDQEVEEKCVTLFWQELRTFDEVTQLIIIAHYLHRESFREIALDVNWEERKVKNRCSTAMATLKRRLRSSV